VATFAAIFAPASASGGIEDSQKAAGVVNLASSAEISVGVRQIVNIFAVPTPGQAPNGYSNVRFGPAGLGPAAATDFPLPDNTLVTVDLGEEFASIRFFNNSSIAGTRDYYVARLARGK
jgi:hypothetical protein